MSGASRGAGPASIDRSRAGTNAWRVLVALVCLWLWPPVFATTADPAEARVGRHYWARPPVSERSVEFHADLRLRERAPVYEKTRFRIEAIEFDDGFPDPTALYRVRFDDDRRAFIPVVEFERQLYHELRANEVAVSPSFEPPLGRGIQVYLFERAALFEADPDLIWNRVKDQGPLTFTPRTSGVPGGAHAPRRGAARRVAPADPEAQPH